MSGVTAFAWKSEGLARAVCVQEIGQSSARAVRDRAKSYAAICADSTNTIKVRNNNNDDDNNNNIIGLPKIKQLPFGYLRILSFRFGSP